MTCLKCDGEGCRYCQTPEQARDDGIKKVTRSSWNDNALTQVETLPIGWQGTGEDVRLQLNIPEPHHPNAWGAMIRSAISRKLLQPTGVYRKTKTFKNHACKREVLRRV